MTDAEFKKRMDRLQARLQATRDEFEQLIYIRDRHGLRHDFTEEEQRRLEVLREITEPVISAPPGRKLARVRRIPSLAKKLAGSSPARGPAVTAAAVKRALKRK
jgi:hypothetical protein